MRSLKVLALSSLASIALAGISFQAAAHETDEAEDMPEIIADEFDRGTPVRSAQGYLEAAGTGDYETAAEYLDLRNLKGEAQNFAGPELAEQFLVIINRADWTDVEELPDHPAGRSGDGLPSYRDAIGKVVFNDKEVELYMQRVPRGDGEFIWKVSNATVSMLPDLYEVYGYPEVIEDLRKTLPKTTFLGFELFKWVAALCLGVITYLSVFLIALIVRKSLGDPDKPSHRQVFRFLIVPFGIWAVIMAMNAAATALGRGLTAEAIERWSPIPILITIWVIFAGINLILETYSNRLERQGRQGAQVLLRPAGNAIKLLVVVAALLVYLDRLGVNITTLLAGLGVGGVAVALALQKPMEDVFGAITLYAQQHVRIGDFCKVGTMIGTVEEIGLRNTTIRTLANTLISVPNAKIVSEPIDNYSLREMILYRPTLRLRYDTNPEQVRNVLTGIHEYLDANENVNEGFRVRFVAFANDALNLEIFAYINTKDWAEYLGLAEEINLKVLQIVANAGTALAVPASTLRIESGESTETADEELTPPVSSE